MSNAVQVQTRLKVADNTGAKEVMCIRILGNSWIRATGIGTVIVASVKKAIPNGMVKQGEVVKCVIVRTKQPHGRQDGSSIRFNENAVVILKEDGTPKGTRIFGCIPNELKEKFPRIASLAEEVL